MVQGREKEITLFSTVRSRVKASIGFVADERRINVGLTRAKCSLIVIGSSLWCAITDQLAARW